jgi:hypothetical protein
MTKAYDCAHRGHLWLEDTTGIPFIHQTSGFAADMGPLLDRDTRPTTTTAVFKTVSSRRAGRCAKS